MVYIYRCLNGIMQSPLPLRSFEPSGPMTLCTRQHMLVVLCRVHLVRAATYVDVYQAELMRRRTWKHACLKIVIYTVYIYIYILMSKCASIPFFYVGLK